MVPISCKVDVASRTPSITVGEVLCLGCQIDGPEGIRGAMASKSKGAPTHRLRHPTPFSEPSQEKRLASAVTVALSTALLMAFIGCESPRSQYPASTASEGISSVARKWQSATVALDGSSLTRLFWDVCLARCHGFRFQPKEKLWGGRVLRFKWAKRSRPGTLVGDLPGQLGSYESVHRSRITLTHVAFQGTQTARARLHVVVDGVLRTGHRRSDRGHIDLILQKRGALKGWRITGYDIETMETLVSRELGFRPTQTLSPSGPKRPHAPEAKVALFDTDGDHHPEIVSASGGSLSIWRRDPRRGSFSRIQSLSIHPHEVTALQAVSLDTIKGPELVVATKRHGVFSFQNTQTPEPFSKSKRPIYNPKTPSCHGLEALSVGGRLGFYLPGCLAPKDASGALARDVLLLQKRKNVFQAVFPQTPPRGEASTPGATVCALSPSPPKKKTAPKKPPRTPRLFWGSVRGAWLLYDESVPSRGSRPKRLSSAITTGCHISDLDGDGLDEWIVTGAKNPWPWVYERPTFSPPWRHLWSPGPWRKRLQRRGRGSYISHGARPSPSKRPRTELPFLGWLSNPLAVDIDGDGLLELAALQRDGGVDLKETWSFWTHLLPRRWGTKKRGFLTSSPPWVDGSSHRFVLLKKNSDGAFSDVAHVLGWSPVESKNNPSAAPVAQITFGDLLGHGAMDAFVLRRDGSGTLWANELPQKNTLRVKIEGTPENRSAVGATLWVPLQSGTKGGVKGVKRRLDGIEEGVTILGVGDNQAVDLVVTWPDGVTHRWEDLSTDSIHELSHP